MTLPFLRQRPGPSVRFFADELHARGWPPLLARPKQRRILIFSLAVLTIGVDYLTGPTIRFPAVYAIPLLLMAWYEGFVPGLLTGAALVGARLAMEGYFFTQVPWPFTNSLINAASSFLVITLICWFTALAGELSREVRLLWGLVPICMYCHKIRDDKNIWGKLETYLEDRSKATFTHGICPSCMKLRSNPA